MSLRWSGVLPPLDPGDELAGLDVQRVADREQRIDGWRRVVVLEFADVLARDARLSREFFLAHVLG